MNTAMIRVAARPQPGKLSLIKDNTEFLPLSKGTRVEEAVIASYSMFDIVLINPGHCGMNWCLLK
jgi:hypothetical protein